VRAAICLVTSSKLTPIKRLRLIPDFSLRENNATTVTPIRSVTKDTVQITKGRRPQAGNAFIVPGRPEAGALACQLSPRQRQTLRGMLQGLTEKELARTLGLSRHTVHVHVKAVYRRFNVCSKGELMAQFIPLEILIAFLDFNIIQGRDERSRDSNLAGDRRTPLGVRSDISNTFPAAG